jgi:hypothetical protein
MRAHVLAFALENASTDVEADAGNAVGSVV